MEAKSSEQTIALARGSVQRTFASYRDGIAALIESSNGELGRSLSEASAMIAASEGRTVVTGMGKSGHIARKVAATLASTGTPAYFVHPSEASHGDLGIIAPKDIVIALSWSGETAELKALLSYTRRFHIPLIAFTADAKSTLAQSSDLLVLLPQVREACPHNLAPTTSTMIQLAAGDALAIALLETRGFSAADFGQFHPAGRLGAMLKFVRDLMHAIGDTPIAPLGTKMSEAVVEMSAKGYGCVGIADRSGELVGIITDGDLRRHMRPDLLDMTVDMVMTKNPKTIRPDQLASQALGIMNAAKVSVLIVADAGKPVGILRMHDILRAGVV